MYDAALEVVEEVEAMGGMAKAVESGSLPPSLSPYLPLPLLLFPPFNASLSSFFAGGGSGEVIEGLAGCQSYALRSAQPASRYAARTSPAATLVAFRCIPLHSAHRALRAAAPLCVACDLFWFRSRWPPAQARLDAGTDIVVGSPPRGACRVHRASAPELRRAGCAGWRKQVPAADPGSRPASHHRQRGTAPSLASTSRSSP